MARSKKRRRPNAATPQIDAARAQRVYAAFADASDAFFAGDETARTQAEAMELDGPMADLRGCLALLAARAKPSCLVAFGMEPTFAKKLVEGLWAPFCREHLPEIQIRMIDCECEPLPDCSLQHQYVAFPETSREVVERAYFAGLEGEPLFEAIGGALGYPNAHGLATDCRVEYRIGEDFVLEFLASSDGFGAVAAHFARCAEALAGVGPLLISVDGVDLDAGAVRAGDEGALRAAGWAPGLNAVEADIDFS